MSQLNNSMSDPRYRQVNAGRNDAAQILAAHYYDRPGRIRNLRDTAREQAIHAAGELRNVAHESLTRRRLAMLRELVHFEILTEAQLSEIVQRVQGAQVQAVSEPASPVNRTAHTSEDDDSGAQSDGNNNDVNDTNNTRNLVLRPSLVNEEPK
jgi:hypothetical protein